MSIIFVLLFNFAFADLTPIQLTSKIEGDIVRWWDEDSIVEHYKKLDGTEKTLFIIERVFRKNDYTSCLGLISKVIDQVSLIKPWLLNKQLKCATKIIKSDKSSLLKQEEPDILWFVKILDNIDSKYLTSDTYSETLKYSWVEANIELLDLYASKKSKLAYGVLNKLFENKNLWGKVPKFQSKIDSILSKLASTDLNSSIAYLHRSLSILDNDELRNMLESLKSQNSKNQEMLFYPEQPEKLLVTNNLFFSKGEKELVDKISNEKNDALDFIKNYFLLLDTYPGSMHLDWATKSAIDTYVKLFKRKQTDLVQKQQANLLVTNSINLVTRDFILALSSKLYWSGVYVEAYNLLKTSFEKDIPGFLHDEFLFQTARAAYTVNEINFAKSIYSKLINQYSGSEFVPESLFRLGLIHLKLKDFSKASVILEQLLLIDDEDLRLGNLYWLWVSLIKQSDKKRAYEISKQILKEYPLTYYSMKVRAHYNNGKLANFILEGPDISLKLLLTNAERQNFKRVQYLLSIGWFDEAAVEIGALSDFDNPTIMAIKSKYWYMTGDFINATKFLQKAWELDKSLIRNNFVGFTYPREFIDIINTNIKKFKYSFSYEIPLSIIRQESLFRVDALSSAGAFGLMQLTPGTMKEVAGLLRVKLDRGDYAQNIKLGMNYIDRMLRVFDGHLPQALAAYNAGIGRYRAWLLAYKLNPKSSVEYIEELWMEDLPYAETRFYVKAILRTILIYKILDNQIVDMKKPFW